MQKCDIKDVLDTRAGAFFWKVTAFPKTNLIIILFVMLATAAFLPKVTKDTSIDAFMPDNHPAVVYRNNAKDIFGLSDPVVVAVVNDGPTGIFNPQSLNLISWLTNRILELQYVDPERVTSLVTENNITGTDDGMTVQPFYEKSIATQEEANNVKRNVMDFPLYLGSLVAQNGSATIIVAELIDEKDGGKLYTQLLELADKAPVGNEKIYVAGEAAVVEYLGKYIDTDLQRLNPIVAVIVALILFFSYRTLAGTLLPNFVLVGALFIGLGSMVAFGVPFYVITGALPVILIAISVADGIHIMGEYYEQVANYPDLPKRELTVLTMTKMWRPVTITSLTDIAGFMGLSLASFMPPLKAFGTFASIGAMAALLISLFGIPSVLVFIRPRKSNAFKLVVTKFNEESVDRFGKIMGKVGKIVIGRPKTILVIGGVVITVGIIGALKIEVNDMRIDNFRHSEPIHQADRIINTLFDGTNYLDIVIETTEQEGLFKPERLKRIESLQNHLETLPHVGGTVSIVDYLKQMNKAVNENNPDAYRLPENSDLVAQYFLLYSVSGSPTDFEEEIDYDYRLANVRVTMDSGLYTDAKIVINAAAKYIEEEFNTQDIKATLTGRQYVSYHWIKQIGNNHFLGVTIAFLAVLLMISLSFRSVVAGLMAMLPVSLAVLIIYAVMGYCGIWLGVGTSMFAAIAIGTGVDFAVHVLDRLIMIVRDEGKTLDSALYHMFPSTGRALLFSFTSIFLGFGVPIFCQALPLTRFGILVVVAVLVSFFTSLTILPAMVKVIHPKFLGFNKNKIT